MANQRGVEVRARSIHMTLTTAEDLQRKTLQVDGTPRLPTPANVKFANRTMAEIRAKVSAVDPGRLPVGHKVLERGRGRRAPAGAKKLAMLLHSDILKALKRKPLHGKTQKDYIDVLHNAPGSGDAGPSPEGQPERRGGACALAAGSSQPLRPRRGGRDHRLHAGALPQGVGNMVEWRFFLGVRTSEMVGCSGHPSTGTSARLPSSRRLCAACARAQRPTWCG
jgi:hypothetical protein